MASRRRFLMAIFMLFSAIPAFVMDCLLAHPMGSLVVDIEPMCCREPHLRNCGRFLAWYDHGSSSWSSDGETRGPRCIKHRGALLCLASAEDLAPTLARMSGLQQLIFKTLCALTCARPESRHDFRFVGDAGQRAAWQRSTLDPHRDPAPGKVIRSCPVASFDLLTKIDPADTISASAAHA